jgi:tetratricopeptide (TPR) repeat protein
LPAGDRITGVPLTRFLLTGVLAVAAGPAALAAQENELLLSLKKMTAAAEEGLRGGELEVAESRYRTALLQGWLVLGELHVSDGRLPDARHAFERASESVVDDAPAVQALALVQMQLGDAEPALAILSRLAKTTPRSVPVRVTLAQALVAAGRPEEAVQELEYAHTVDPKDPQLAFALASGYLRVKNLQGAERLFAQVAAARPSAHTYVLIGRTYRDFRFFEPARSALRRALKMDPKTPRAHYYLGTAAVMEEGVVKVDEAIAEFREELRIVPDDPPTTLRLGMALVEARRDAEALPLLQKATAVPSPSPDAWLYLGRCQLALGRAGEAIVSFRRALDTGGASRSAADSGVGQSRSRLIHYQLGTALRQTGAAEEAEREFAEAERLSAKRTETDRSELANYLADAPDANAVGLALALEVSGFEKLTPQQRTAIASTVRGMLARAYLNLGIVHAQGHRFDRAAELFELAAEVEPAFPQVQYSLGVAYFNSKQYAKAAAALERALEQAPGNGDVRRMLALAALNAEDYAKAADLLRDDPRRSGDPSLQYAYGIALVQSNRAEEAQVIFTRIVNEHPDVAEVNVVLGQAYAAQGDYEAAVKSLNRAIELKPTVAEAQASLGLIYLQQGKLPEAAAALRAELTVHPDDVKARYTLATVLDLQSKPDEATAELQVILKAFPRHANARYLFGKVLLSRGSADAAVEQLQFAMKLAPDDPNIHYQLGQAYQRLGRAEQAAQEFEAFRQLKDKKRGGRP